MSLSAIFSSNLQLKIFSLLLALVLWVFVALESESEIDLPLQVRMINLPKEMQVKELRPTVMSIHLAGPRILLFRQQLKGVTVMLDLSGVKPGRTVFSGLDRNASLVTGVKPVNTQPLIMEIAPVSLD
jgi:hypothetical protein